MAMQLAGHYTVISSINTVISYEPLGGKSEPGLQIQTDLMDTVEQRDQSGFRAVKLDLHLQWLRREEYWKEEG